MIHENSKTTYLGRRIQQGKVVLIAISSVCATAGAYIFLSGATGVVLALLVFATYSIGGWREWRLAADDGIEFVYCGTQFRPLDFLIGGVGIGWVVFAANIGVFFFVFAALLMGVVNIVRVIVFDYNKKQVHDLFDNDVTRMDNAKLEKMDVGAGNEHIRITDASGFFVLKKKDFRQEAWTALVSRLERISTIEITIADS